MGFLNRIRWGIIISSAFILFSYQNCAYVGQVQDSTSASTLGVDSAASTSSDPVVLNKNAMTIINSRCVSCHTAGNNPGGGVDYLTDLTLLKYYRVVIPGEPQISPMYELIISGSHLSRPLTQTQTQTIYDWILKGM